MYKRQALGLGRNTVLTIHDVQSAMQINNPLKRLYVKLFWFWLPALLVGRITVISCLLYTSVVAIHYGPYWINPISRIAVPLFFMITGYYFVTFSAISKFRKHFRKILIMTISASLFYGFLSFSSAIYFGTFDNWFDSKFNLKTIAVYTLFDLDLFQIHLWY